MIRKNIALYDRQEKSILLYAETCLVDNNGKMANIRMNKEDADNLDKMKEEGLLDWGRLPFKEIEKWSKLLNTKTPSTHWVSFTPEAWKLAWAMRKERAVKGKEQLDKTLKEYE